MTKSRQAGLTLILAIAAGCATNQTQLPEGDDGSDRDLIDEVETFLKRSGRVAELAFPILTSNVELCGKRVTRLIGLSWLLERELPRGNRDVFVRRYGVSDSPTLDNVVNGGPAGAAGLRRWDTITAVDGDPVRGRTRSAIREVFREAAEDGEITLTYERDGRTMVTVIAPIPACDVGVHLVQRDQVDAHADRMFTHGDERTADRVSMYMLERAGVDPHAAIDFWRTMALESPEAMPFDERHPVNARRLDGLDSALAEVAAKRKAGQPMVPNP